MVKTKQGIYNVMLAIILLTVPTNSYNFGNFSDRKAGGLIGGGFIIPLYYHTSAAGGYYLDGGSTTFQYVDSTIGNDGKWFIFRRMDSFTKIC